jgi:hypothetical protein
MEVRSLPYTQNAAIIVTKRPISWPFHSPERSQLSFSLLILQNVFLKSDVATTVKRKTMEATTAVSQNKLERRRQQMDDRLDV